ncbi:MAG: D-alanine--D-alanine ligase [Candidatus Pacebacteria bacterium]|nr:D-alanine--D-alanine ligase [Candidatus Paceibacterota bacterium]
MNKKLKVSLLFGGKSVEHEVSILSAKNVFEAINKDKYDVSLIGIDKSGYWRFFTDAKILEQKSIKSIAKNHNGFLNPDCGKVLVNSDVVFPVLHGTYGEDGSVQGFLKLINKPFVGAGVLGSALGMDKEVQKRLLIQAEITTAKFLTYQSSELSTINYHAITTNLDLPFFIKPANSGSSVGASKVKNEPEFMPAIYEAFKYDNKILIEEFIDGREIECSVLGNSEPIASIPGEVVSNHEFYSYEAKYLDENGAVLKIPAKLNKITAKKIQELAIKTFKVLECSSMGRVDFFLKRDGQIFINEINTIPGFTSISMYPKLWEATGISYSELIDRLIELAIEKFEKDSKIKTSY